MKYRNLLTLLPVVSATSGLFERIPELRLTGLTEEQLDRLIQPRVSVIAANSSCPANVTAANVNATFPKPTFPSTQDLLKRNYFVERQGTKLNLVGKDFRIVGANAYWLGLDENAIPDPSYPSKRRVMEVMGIISAMRGTTIRSHTLGISVGNPLSIEPSLDVFNDVAYESIDFAILAARIYGIKLLIPLVDNYNYFNGGKYQFIGFHGIPFNGTGANITPPDVGAYFYNTTAIVDSFKRYITHHLNHVNQFTGIALKDDPTILAWETGNELSAARFGDGPAPPAWTKEVAQLIKSLAPNHLVLDGSYGIDSESGMLDNKEVDMFSDHFYPLNITRYTQGRDLVTAAGRNYIAGEYDWLDTIERWRSFGKFPLCYRKSGVGDGDIFWSLFGHDDECCEYVEHDDGYSFYYKRAQLYDTQGTILINHANNINSAFLPQILPEVACPAKVFPANLIPPNLNHTWLQYLYFENKL